MSEQRVTPSSGNVFADLGLPDAEALLAQADAVIAARDTGAGGVITTSRMGVAFTVGRGEAIVTRRKRGRETREGVPGDFITLDIDRYLVEWLMPYQFTPTEARQLAAALVAQADAIEGQP